MDHESLPMDKSMTLAKTYNFFMIQFLCLNVPVRLACTQGAPCSQTLWVVQWGTSVLEVTFVLQEAPLHLRVPQDCIMLAISVMLDLHSRIISSAPWLLLNPRSLSALGTSTLTVENGSQETASSALLGISVVVLEHILLSCALLGTSVCQVPTSVHSIRVQREPLAPGLVPLAALTVSPVQQACIAQHQVCPSLLDCATQVIAVPAEPPAQRPSNTG
ncbi:uncharacterized protein [Anas acuta]|uniref:uncharacterized protein n=1 Tax=Anas acuta TaxID=28680 RepID=UPI0035C8BF3D